MVTLTVEELHVHQIKINVCKYYRTTSVKISTNKSIFHKLINNMNIYNTVPGIRISIILIVHEIPKKVSIYVHVQYMCIIYMYIAIRNRYGVKCCQFVSLEPQ
jgi:hypothetical protein